MSLSAPKNLMQKKIEPLGDYLFLKTISEHTMNSFGSNSITQVKVVLII
jgi:hypothetical protein